MDNNDLLTRQEVAELLGVKPDWVSMMVARKELPFVVQGSRWKADDYRFRRRDLLAWMAENERATERKLTDQ